MHILTRRDGTFGFYLDLKNNNKKTKKLDDVRDLGLFRCCWFPRRELLEVIDEFNDDFQYLTPTKESLSAVVDDNDVGFHVLGCRVDILGTNCKTLVGSWSCICTANRRNLLAFSPFSPKNLKLPRIAQETYKKFKRKIFNMS